MKKTSLFLLGAMTLGLAACSSEEPAVKGGAEASEGDFYTTLTLNFGTGTRSETNSDDETGKGSSTDGEEYAILPEYNIDEILVILCQKQNDGSYKHVTHALANAVRKTNAPATTPTYVVRFETQDLYDLAGDDEFTLNSTTKGETLYVFTYCNPTEEMKDVYGYEPKQTNVGDFDPDAIFDVSNAELWTPNAFPMSNAALESVQLPSKYELLYDYNKETTPFNLGTVTVQRMATRFDLAEKTETVNVNGTEMKNTYAIQNPVNNVVDAYVTIDAVSFFNEAKECYGFMHTSATGNEDGWRLCGYDRIGQYVVSPYWRTTGLRGQENFNYSLVDENNKLIGPKEWDYTTIASVIGVREDNWDNGKRDYYFWKYSTPNTIPSPISNQIKGNTTGVLYRAYITPNQTNTDLYAAMNNGDVIYAFEGILYGNQAMLQKYVATHPESEVKRMYDKTFNEDGTLKSNDPHFATKTGGFTVYTQDEDGKYYCYYYYYNRHNDNGNNTVMGDMEFAAVRNNVYKLYVESVKVFGHPGDPDDDENPEDPEDPDESPQTYFKVQVEVLPWVVRVNDIQF